VRQMTKVRRSDGAKIAHVSGRPDTLKAVHENDEFYLVEGYQELTPPTRNYLQEARIKRDRLLNHTQWTVITGSPLTAENQNEWTIYREKLHSIVMDTPDLSKVVWPTQPEYKYKAKAPKK
jgi:hypothetical protein